MILDAQIQQLVKLIADSDHDDWFRLRGLSGIEPHPRGTAGFLGLAVKAMRVARRLADGHGCR
jgi:hypothetical protein